MKKVETYSTSGIDRRGANKETWRRERVSKTKTLIRFDSISSIRERKG